MNSRIKQIRAAVGLSQTDFGAKIGVTIGVIRNLESGITHLTSPLFELFCSVYDVNAEWLRTGNGEMFLPVGNNLLTAVKERYNLSEKAFTIVDNFIKLPKSEQENFIAQIEKIINADNDQR